MNFRQASSVNEVRIVHKRSHLLNNKFISVLKKKQSELKLARHQSTYKTTYVKFFSTIENSYYMPILLKMSERAAKMIHKGTFKDNHGSIVM